MIGGGNGGKPGSAPMPAGFPRKIDFHCEAGRWGTPAAPKMGENGGEKVWENGGVRWKTCRAAPPCLSKSFPQVFHAFSTAFSTKQNPPKRIPTPNPSFPKACFSFSNVNLSLIRGGNLSIYANVLYLQRLTMAYKENPPQSGRYASAHFVGICCRNAGR